MKGGGLQRTMAGLTVTLASLVAAAASQETTKPQLREATCIVQSGSKGLDVRCPNATVAELLNAFGKATGLRSEYPNEFATMRVSVTLRRVQLHDALRSALDAFNFATWQDQRTPAVTWLRVVGLRRTVDGTQQAWASQHPAPTYSEAAPSIANTAATVATTTTASIFQPQDRAEMARVREDFANSIIPAAPLAPPGKTEGAPVSAPRKELIPITVGTTMR